MKHTRYYPQSIPLIVSVNYLSFVVRVFLRAGGDCEEFSMKNPFLSPDCISQSLCSKVNVWTNNKLDRIMKRGTEGGGAGGHFSNNKFVLGGWTAFGSRVCVGLVADRHLHGESQSLLVNSPVDTEATAWKSAGVFIMNVFEQSRPHPMCVTASRFS